MSKHPDAVYCDEFGGDFVSFVKQATPLGYFKAINNRLVDGGEVGSVDITRTLGSSFPVGIWANAYDPVIWDGPNRRRPTTRSTAGQEGDEQRTRLRAGR